MPKNLGMYNPVSKDLMAIMTKQLGLPWVKRHRCKHQMGFFGFDGTSATPTQNYVIMNQPQYCSFCEEYVLWFNFAKDILMYISPKQEQSVIEVHFHNLVDLNLIYNKSLHSHHSFTKPQYTAFTSPVGSILNIKTNPFNTTQNAKTSDDSQQTNENSDDVNKENKTDHDPEMGVWNTSQGVYYFKLSSLHVHLQLFYTMLKEFPRVPDTDSLYNLLICLKMLIVHCECLETAFKDQKGFLIFCMEKYLIPKYDLKLFIFT